MGKWPGYSPGQPWFPSPSVCFVYVRFLLLIEHDLSTTLHLVLTRVVFASILLSIYRSWNSLVSSKLSRMLLQAWTWVGGREDLTLIPKENQTTRLGGFVWLSCLSYLGILVVTLTFLVSTYLIIQLRYIPWSDFWSVQLHSFRTSGILNDISQLAILVLVPVKLDISLARTRNSGTSSPVCSPERVSIGAVPTSAPKPPVMVSFTTLNTYAPSLCTT